MRAVRAQSIWRAQRASEPITGRSSDWLEAEPTGNYFARAAFLLQAKAT